MTLQINSNNEIILDGKPSGFGVTQKQHGTRVYKINGDYVDMPTNRYNLTTDNELAPGTQGRSQFEVDVRAMIYAQSSVDIAQLRVVDTPCGKFVY